MASGSDQRASTVGGETAERPRRADWSRTRQRILDAARAEFSQNGYSRTNTRRLAEAATVAESTLFRHFPTKAQLFEQAVITPLQQSLELLTEQRRSRPAQVSTEEAAAVFYDSMIATLRSQSALLIAGLASMTFDRDTEEFASLTGAFAELLGYVDEIFDRSTEERNFGVDPFLASRLVLAACLGLALGDELLFTGTRQASHKEIVAALAEITAFGLPGRPAAPATGADV